MIETDFYSTESELDSSDSEYQDDSYLDLDNEYSQHDQHRSGAATECWWCKGTGIEPGSHPTATCSHCGGSGIGPS